MVSFQLTMDSVMNHKIANFKKVRVYALLFTAEEVILLRDHIRQFQLPWEFQGTDLDWTLFSDGI